MNIPNTLRSFGLFVSLCFISFNLNAVNVDGVEYTIKNNRAQVSKKSPAYEGDIVIPSEIEWGGTTYPVTSIGYEAFEGCQGLRSVVLSNNMTTLPNAVFRGCSSLTSVKLPESLEAIPESAFENCTSLNSESLGAILDGVQIVKTGAFRGCSGLTEVNLGNPDQNVWANAFEKCSNIESVTINVESIRECVFMDCSRLSSITLGEDVKRFSETAFQGCKSINSINVDGDNLNFCSIDGVLYGKNDNNTLILNLFPKARIGSFTVPDNVMSIKSNAFDECENLTSINLPESLQYIRDRAFHNCSSLTSINIPDGVTEIGDLAFGYCSGLTEMRIPANIQRLGEGIFEGCTSLSSVFIPESVKELPRYTFNGCSALKSITLPQTIELIGDYVFQNCGIENISLPKSVAGIGNYVFLGCQDLESIGVDEQNQNYSSIDGILFDKSRSTLLQYPAAKSGNYEIPESVNTIWHGAFAYNKFISEIAIPESVTILGTNAFAYSEILNFANIKAHGELGYDAFAFCEDLKTVIIDSSIESIGSSAFFKCDKLSRVISLNPEPPVCGWNVFDYVPSDASLMVYDDAFDKYASAEGWSYFDNISILPEIAIILKNENIELNVGECITVDPIIINSSGITEISRTWHSLNSDIATINGNGEIEALAPGVAEMVMLVIASDGRQFSKKFTVEVNNSGTKVEQIITYCNDKIDMSEPYKVYSINGNYIGDDIRSLNMGVYIVWQNSKYKKVMVK